MRRYILRRLLQGIALLVVLALVVFALARVTGNPADLLLSEDATAEDRAHLLRALGLDRPVHEQLVLFLGGAVRGDLGQSIRYRKPAVEVFFERLPNTLTLLPLALVGAVVLAIPLGLLAAVYRGTLIDRACGAIAVLGIATPSFWLGIVLIYVFSIKLGLLPSARMGGPSHYILPAVTLTCFFTAATARLTRSSILDVLDMDYVRYARLKGVPEFVVIIRHVLRNAFITILNIVALQLGILLGGSVITEFIFSWPGIGRLSLEAVYNRDYPVIQATVVVAAAFFVVINLLVDIIYSATDPRVSRK